MNMDSKLPVRTGDKNESGLEKETARTGRVRAETVLASVKGTLEIIHDVLEIKKIRDNADAKVSFFVNVVT